MRALLFGLFLGYSSLLIAQNTFATISELNRTEGWLRSAVANTITGAPRILLYQHGGATMNLSGSAVGQVNDLNGAGHYDLNQVSRISGDTIFLALPLKHTYAISVSQLIIAPNQEEVVVTETITAPPFDGTTGGVVFLAASDQLTIAAKVSAAETGFRGGQGQEADSDCSRFTVANAETYGLGNWRGSARGEGIAGVPAGQEAGRAPAANGGGGGNDHNTGGGGGGNTAGGGDGAINVVSGLFNNACRGNFPGRGGRALDSSTERAYFGGGGGAGHANNTETAAGGNGGGLVVLWAENINFTETGSVDVSGATPGLVDGDGGGGGGAAGSVIIIADILSGTPQLDLSGGRGADVQNFSDRCFGPGGGGGGGRLMTAVFDRSGWSPTVDLSAGGFGQRLGSDDCGPTDEPAGTGTPGSEQTILFPVPFGGFIQSADTLCTDQQLLLTDASNGAQQASWEIVPASEALTADLLGLSLRVSFADTAAGTFQAIQTLFLNGEAYPGDTATFTVFPVANADGGDIVVVDEFVTATVDAPSGFTAIRYDFGDGTVIDTNVTSLSHTYTAGGDYTITILLLNPNCGDLELATEMASLPEFAFADTDAKTPEGCAPYELTVLDESTGFYTGSRWDFPGAEPSVIFDELSPTVVYPTPGVYEASLTLLGAFGPDTVETFTVTVSPTPTVSFSFNVDTSTVMFTATTDVANEFSWNFGDSLGTSQAMNPVYTYDSTGTFLVTLEANLGACTTTITEEVTIDVLSDISSLQQLGVKLFPNPTTGQLQLMGEALLLDIFDLNGKRISALSGGVADLSWLPAGTYIVRVVAEGKIFSVRVLRH